MRSVSVENSDDFRRNIDAFRTNVSLRADYIMAYIVCESVACTDGGMKLVWSREFPEKSWDEL